MSCNGCRVLRKGCSDTCILRSCLQWIESQEAQGHATVFVAKFFGRAGLMSFISGVPEDQRPSLFQSLLYEACGRTVNPVTGAVGLLLSGNWSVCQLAVEAVLEGVCLKPCPNLSTSLSSSSTKSKHHVRNALPGLLPQIQARVPPYIDSPLQIKPPLCGNVPSLWLRHPSAAAASCLDPRDPPSPIPKMMKRNNSSDVHVTHVDESGANSALAISSLVAEDEVCKSVAPAPVRPNEKSVCMIQDHQVEQQEAELSSTGSYLDLNLNSGLQGVSRVSCSRDRRIAGNPCTSCEVSAISCELSRRSRSPRHEPRLLQLLT